MAGYSAAGAGTALAFTLALTRDAGENCDPFDVLATSSAGYGRLTLNSYKEDRVPV